MWKSRILLAVVAVGIGTGLYFLPKSVVENESQLKSETVENAPGDPHSDIPMALAEAIAALRPLAQPVLNEKSATFADSLSRLYAQAGKYDSSAWYAGEAATFFKSLESCRQAAARYYEAYSFAVDPERQKVLAAEAQRFLNQVLEQRPDDLDAQGQLAMTLLATAPPMQGIRKLQEIIQKDPQNEFALFNLGMLSVQTSQYERAQDYLARLLEIKPDNSQARMLLGVAYLNGGDKDKARAEFEEVKKRDPDPAVQAAADSYLKDLR